MRYKSMKKHQSNQKIDLFLLGSYLRKVRQEAGYRTVQEFIEALYELGGYSISRDLLYMVERGEREPEFRLLVTYNFAIGKDPLDMGWFGNCLEQITVD